MTRRLVIPVCLLLSWLVLGGYAQAQETTPAVVVHVVQRDETLLQIAQRYGTTLEDLVALNGLLNPNSLQVGQRLLIPSGRLPTAGVATAHTVQAGETLYTLSARYRSSLESLARTNRLTSAVSLYVGQELIIPQGSSGALPPDGLDVYRVQAGDTLWRLALRHQAKPADVLAWNGLDPLSPLQVGQLLLLPPPASAPPSASTLPAPLTALHLTPLPAKQGGSLAVYIQAEAGLSLTLQIFDRELPFAAVGADYLALVGIHSFTEAGLYPFTVRITRLDGAQSTYMSRLRVIDGGYGQETINLPPDRRTLLDPTIIGPELERVTALMSAYSPTRYFSGLMSLPSTGPITSQYGTRRSYQDSDYRTFHGGADFGGAAGSMIQAPADGVVILAEALTVRGNTLIIDHGWGVYTGYWHNAELFVKAGQTVKRGDIIASLGATGLVTGAHLHWEMWVGGVQVDPLQWVTQDFDPFDS